MDIKRIICPDSKLSRSERIAKIIDCFDQWLSVKELADLIHLFGAESYSVKEKEVLQRIVWLKEEFMDVWDYRKKQKEALTKEKEAARWLLENDELVNQNQELIYNVSRRLGLIGIGESVYQDANYILPLGGARMSNLRRCELAKREVGRRKNQLKIVALSGMRPIAETEREGYIDTYAADAKTEYDAICSGMKLAFEEINGWQEENYEDPNPNLSYAITHFTTQEKTNYELYALAAPSTMPERRANSSDCFKFFFTKFSVPKYSKIINCTSQIYCTYQQVRSLFYAIDYEVEFDTIGFPFYLNNAVPGAGGQQLAKPVNYLQEIKATIDAMYDFVKRYC